MLISCNKLKEYIKNADTIDWIKVWDKFSIRTAEVEGVEVKGNRLRDVVVAEIIHHELHPTKDKYHILKVSDGTSEYDVLCGAPNCRVGLKVAYVKVGGMVCGFEISEKKIAGVLSQGMCCALDELEIGSDHSGILELPNDAPLGMDITDYYPNIKDIIVEIDNKSLTNRPDLWGHYGIAREISAITGTKLLPLELEEISNDKEDIAVRINQNNLCFRFNALRIDNVTVKDTSMNMKIFLHYTGMRSISPLVDISNYIMLELGQPNHAYDAEKVKEIVVDLANDGDKFTTLDKVERSLTKETLMIKNEKDFIGIAGIMGGLDSEIEDTTTSVLVEAASFDAGSIRKTATALGLRSEASSRFEKSLDPNMTEIAVKRFVKVLKDMDTNIKVGSNLTDVYPNQHGELQLSLNKNKLQTYIGFDISEETVKSILNSLEFKTEAFEDYYSVTVPTFRATKDIKIEEDLIEEIVRMYGFENIELKPLKLDLSFKEHENVIGAEYTVKRFLSEKYNLHEVHTYLWYKSSFLNKLNLVKDNVKLLSKNEDNILRDDLNVSMLEALENNSKGYDNTGIYEIGTVIQKSENKRQLSVCLMDDNKNIEKTYETAKNIVYNLFETFKNTVPTFSKVSTDMLYDQDLSLGIFVNDCLIGNITTLANQLIKKKAVVFINLNFDLFVEVQKESMTFKQISKYPSINLDYSVIAPLNSCYEEINHIVINFNNSLINNVKFIDLFESDSEKRYTFRFIIGSYERTLTANDIEDFKNAFIKHIKSNNLNIVE